MLTAPSPPRPPPTPPPYLSPFLTFILEQNFKKKPNTFNVIRSATSEMSPWLDNTKWTGFSWWFSSFASNTVFSHPSIKPAETTFHRSNSCVKGPLLLLPLLEAKWGYKSNSPHTPPTVLYCFFFLPLHQTKACGMENTDIAFPVVLNYTVIVFLSEGVKRIIFLWVMAFLWRMIITDDHVRTNNRRLSFIGS